MYLLYFTFFQELCTCTKSKCKGRRALLVYFRKIITFRNAFKNIVTVIILLATISINLSILAFYIIIKTVLTFKALYYPLARMTMAFSATIPLVAEASKF